MEEKSLLEATHGILSSEDVSEDSAESIAKLIKTVVGKDRAKRIGDTINPDKVKEKVQSKVNQAGERGAKAITNKLKNLLNRESTMSEHDNNTEILEAGPETPTLDTKSEEDPKLYQDAEGGHAKIDTDEMSDNSKKNMASIAGKGGAKVQKPKGDVNVKEHLEALFDGEELSETFQSKASTIFEAAINERISQIEEDLTEQYQTILENAIEETSSELAEKLDDYLGYVVEQWVEENKLAVDNGIRAEVAENFISGLKVLFENCYIDVPNEKYDLLEEVTDVKNELEEDLNKALQENIDLRKEIVSHRCGEIFADEADGLTDVEVEKLASLSEGIEFETEEQYRDKIQVLRESYFTGNPVVLTEEEETTNQVISEGGPMDRYMSTLSRHSKHDRVS